MVIKTQIGGKYSATELSLFILKKKILDAGIKVTHPISNNIVTTIDNRGYSFDPNIISFYEVERDYYNSIISCTFHTVNNLFHQNKGYLGYSASLEISYAMTACKPILLMYPLSFSDTVDSFILELISKRKKLFFIHDLFIASQQETQNILQKISSMEINYALSCLEQEYITDKVNSLFSEIKKL